MNQHQISDYDVSQFTTGQVYQMSPQIQDLPLVKTVKLELDANLTIEQLNEHLKLSCKYFHKVMC